MTNKFKSILLISVLASSAFMLGCSEDSEEVKLARIQANKEIRVAQLHNYPSSVRYNNGYHNDTVVVHHNDPTSSLVTGAALGMGAAMLFAPTTRVVEGRTVYFDRDNNSISQTEYNRRKAQSAKAKASNKAKAKAQSTKNKPTVPTAAQKAKVDAEKKKLAAMKAKSKASMAKQRDLAAERKAKMAQIQAKKAKSSKSTYKPSSSRKSYSSSRSSSSSSSRRR